MRAFGILLVGVVVGSLGGIGGRPEPVVAQDKAPVAVQKWEYRMEFVPAAGLTERTWRQRMAAVGDEGWELVAVTPDGHGYFKRPKR